MTNLEWVKENQEELIVAKLLKQSSTQFVLVLLVIDT